MEKAASFQRSTLKDIQKAGEPLLKTTLKVVTSKSGCLEVKYKEMRGGSGLLQSTVHDTLFYVCIYIYIYIYMCKEREIFSLGNITDLSRYR